MKKLIVILTVGLMLVFATGVMAKPLDKASPKSAGHADFVKGEDGAGLAESGGWMKIRDDEGINLILLSNRYKACEVAENRPPFCEDWEETKEHLLDAAREDGILGEDEGIEMLLPPHTR
ncbi:MAG: hypothetical protein ACOCZ6_00275 [Nanoarchaeota archaeon]